MHGLLWPRHAKRPLLAPSPERFPVCVHKHLYKEIYTQEEWVLAVKGIGKDRVAFVLPLPRSRVCVSVWLLFSCKKLTSSFPYEWKHPGRFFKDRTISPNIELCDNKRSGLKSI